MAGFYIQPIDGGQIIRTSVSSSAGGAINSPGGTAGFIIRVYRLILVCTGATNIKFQDGSTDLTGAMALAANGSITLDNSGEPWFVCTAGNAFAINSSASTQVSGAVWYTLNQF